MYNYGVRKTLMEILAMLFCIMQIPIHYTSIAPYFVLMALFIAEAWAIQHAVPFYRNGLSASADRNRFVELDGLRGLLALGVFFTHALASQLLFATGHWDRPHSNFYAQMAVAPVAVFFLITGFLFWSRAQRGALGTWREFLDRRFWRLFPTYLFSWILWGFIIAVRTGFTLRVPVFNLLRSLLSILSFELIAGPPLNGYSAIIDVFWSLRVEWMFYISLLFLAFFARTARRQLVLLAIAVGIYFVLPLLLPFCRMAGFGTFGLGTLSYFDFFLVAYFSVGMLTAFIHDKFKLKWLAGSSIASLIAIALIVVVYAFVAPVTSPLEGMILGVPFLLIVHGNSFWGFLRVRPLVMLGKISYSTYLLHPIVLYIGFQLVAPALHISTLTPLAFWIFIAINGLAVVALSAFSYRFFEAPFLKGFAGMRKVTQLEQVSASVEGSS
jgi:peptidoglycan/LPS O-acetylase OafA/YrhL